MKQESVRKESHSSNNDSYIKVDDIDVHSSSSTIEEQPGQGNCDLRGHQVNLVKLCW